jgi:glycosyltransferase involved in cell wall biosynthesis
MSAAPLVSLLIPVFNASRWLPAALESALAQTHRPLEIIAVDDGSTDASGDILARYETRGVKVISQENRGQSAAINRALREASGDYIKFFDADDLLSPDTISTQLAALAGKPRHLAYGTWGRFYADPAETRFTPHPGWHDSDAPLDWLCETWADTEPMYQCALWLIPRPLLDQVGGWDERLSLINDFEFFTRLVLTADGIVFTPEAKLYYRSGVPGSLSAQKSRRAWESAILSTTLGVKHLLARENTAETRRLSADMLQKLVYALYPAHPDLTRGLLREIQHLGGSRLPPDGGPALKRLARLIGWRPALRLHALLGRRPR